MMSWQLTQLPNPRHNIEAKSPHNEVFYEILNLNGRM